MRARFLFALLFFCGSLAHTSGPWAQDPSGVDEAIDRGVDFLLSRQLRDGSFHEHAARYGSGATALAVFALLESGLDEDHPAIRRAFAYLDTTRPTKVYTAALQLLAYAELETLDKQRRRHVSEVLALLLSWQRDDFGYPFLEESDGSARGDDPGDLSNTQFGALGLRAAIQIGLKVPRSAFEDLLHATLPYQEKERKVEVPPDPEHPERSRTGTSSEAGFRYRVPPSQVTRTGKPLRNARPTREVTGSMTAAGLTVLAVVRDAAGSRLGKADRRKLEASARLALRWLANHFDAANNPGSRQWFLYYLYGVERVGAFFELERLGTHDWYAEGARELLRRQTPFGAWGGRTGESATAFALLFLDRATAPSTGNRTRVRRALRARGDAHLIGTGDDALTLWIDGFEDRWLGEGRRPPRILWVAYIVDGREVARIHAGEKLEGKASADPRIPYVHRFRRTGVHRVSAKVAIAAPPDGTELVLDTGEFEVDVRTAWGDWMEDSARAAARNLLRSTDGSKPVAEITASSGEDAELAVDGLQGTAWVSDPGDRQPTLTLTFDHTLRAQEIRIGGADARGADLGTHDRIARARVVVDARDTFYVDFDADPLAPGVLRFERRRGVRRLEITLVERVPGSGREHSLGIAEVLVLDRP
ncbi:MAG TPA: hypothetical protein ENJ09_01015 [Planctomycetes bacterium]|nr:hypothetical protein [Planctomycetota bacterium]